MMYLPVELWALVIANHDSHDRSLLLPLQRTSKQLYALVTPLVYSSISITFSDSNAFLSWATARSGQQICMNGVDWKPKTPYTSFPHICIPFHRLPRLYATLTSNPSLAKYTVSLTINPFSGKVRLVDGWRDLVEKGWEELRGILPFFTNLQRVSVRYSLVFPSEILCSLPATVKLTHLEILQSDESVLSLLQFHSNLQFVSLSIAGPSSTAMASPVIDLPRLVWLEAGPSVWAALFPRLSSPSLSAVRHLSITLINEIPPSIPATLTLNNLQSLRLSPDDPALIAQFGRHLCSIKYLSIMAINENVSEINAIFNIPSRSLVYIYLLVDTQVDLPTVASLFERFPKLAIVDWEFSDDYMRFGYIFTRCLRRGWGPIRWIYDRPEPGQIWWEKASEEVERVTVNE
ncbi:hypothetical protein ONZ45_g5782 [Pleurotus djamor]|nr:hypothetical protein ONZ45_g5782 [Pleurotus djamor]